MKTYKIILLIGIACPGLCLAETMRDLRLPDEREKWERASVEVAQRIQKILGDLELPELEFEGAALSGTSLPYTRPMRSFSSFFFRNWIGRAGDALRFDDAFGVPEPFDPSRFIAEIEEQAFQQDLNVLKEALGDWDVFLQELIRYKRSRHEDTSSVVYTAAERELAENLRQALNSQEAQKEADATIQSRLGRLEIAEIYAGRVTRLRFRHPSGETLRVSLSMLVSYRTGVDDYFVKALGLISHLLEEKLEPYWERTREGGLVLGSDGKFRTRRLRGDDLIKFNQLWEAFEFMRGLFEGASFANERLATLDQEQLHLLILLFLEFRKGDFPVAEEMTDLTERIQRRHQEWTADPSSGSDEPGFLRAYQFYSGLQQDVAYLEYYLEVESSRREFREQLMEDIRNQAH